MNRKIRAYLIRFRRETSAVLAALCVTGIVNHIAPLHSSTIAVATRDIDGGSLISAGDVALAHSLVMWSTAIQDVSLVAGTRAARDLHAGQPLSQDDVTDPANYASGDLVAVSIAVTPSDAHLVRAGDTIDLLATSDSSTTTVAAGAAVLSIQGAATASVMSVGSGGALVLAVTPTEARAIADAHDSAFTVVLRNRL